MPAYVKDGGIWRTPSSIFAKVAGVWERIDVVYTRVAGVWVGVFYDEFNLVISTNQTNLNLRALCVSAGWNQISPVRATINGGVVISGSTAANDAMVIDGSFPGGLTLINNGYIIGVGGSGGAGGSSSFSSTDNGSAGASGRTGVAVSVPVTIQNNGTIAGGGGGGGGGGAAYGSRFTPGYCDKICYPDTSEHVSAGGGGGGGGRSGTVDASGGAAGASLDGINQTNQSPFAAAGGGGSFSTSGAGGAGSRHRPYNDDSLVAHAGSGGGGGFWGSSGATGQSTIGFAGVNEDIRYRSGGAGGAGGLAVWGNNYITWSAVGTRYGGIAE